MKKILIFFLLLKFFVSFSQITHADTKINSHLLAVAINLVRIILLIRSKIRKIEIDTHNYKVGL